MASTPGTARGSFLGWPTWVVRGMSGSSCMFLVLCPFGSSFHLELNGPCRWLNDTGWVTAFAFDGVTGVTEITKGAVTQAELLLEAHQGSPEGSKH